ncbi:hypothetical protein EDB83DRAFT_2320325 [Lactarius deliciosus]|nr:hypothetical protein EDB83DRAFT_2320325 [Lactarius deliciosus]
MCVLATGSILGISRPSVICAVSVGQNTKKPFAIPALDAVRSIVIGRSPKLRLAVQDVLIAEDDPSFLHIGDVKPPKVNPLGNQSLTLSIASHLMASSESTRRDASSVDAFSKMGLSLGLLTCCPLSQCDRNASAGRRRRTHAVPLVMALLTQWMFDGYHHWLPGSRTQYRHHRDLFVDCLAEGIELFPTPGATSGGCDLTLCLPADGAVAAVAVFWKRKRGLCCGSVIRTAIIGHVRMANIHFGTFRTR